MTATPSVPLACRLHGALVFAAAAGGKVAHRHELAGVVANYHLVSDALAAPAAWMIVGLETLIVLSLVSAVWLKASAALAIVLLCVFTLAMGINLARRHREIDCGCFQSVLRQRQKLSAGLIVRNLPLSVTMAPLFGTTGSPARPLQWVTGLGRV